MLRLLPEENVADYLTAFADGELDAEGMLLVLDHLTDHPESIRLIRDHQMLRIVARRMVVDETPPASRALQERVSQLVATARRSNAGRSRSWMPRIRWPLYFVATILLIAAGLIVRQHLLRPTAPPPVPGLAPRPTALHPS